MADEPHPFTRPVHGPVLVSALDTPFGAFLLATRDGRIICTRGPRADAIDPLRWGHWRWPDLDVRPARGGHRRAAAQFTEYFAGRRRAFDLPLALHGSELHVRAWLAAIEIPYATTRTYGDIAWEIGAPGAARAVGRAMTLCELPILVPCHRVIGSGGRRCGALDAWEERCRLLDFEREQTGRSRKPRIPVDHRRGNRIA